MEFKRCVTGAGIFGIVIDKLYHGKEPCPIILLKVDKGSKVGFYHIILPFGLHIRLGVENDRDFLLDA